MSTRQEMQRFIRYWKEQTGETEVDMHEVAKLAATMGWKLPVPQSPIDLLAKRFKDAARDETEYDEETGNPYRVYHAVPAKTPEGQTSMFVYVDIRDAKRNVMLKSAVIRREQMIGDGLQLTFDTGTGSTQRKNLSISRWTWGLISSGARTRQKTTKKKPKTSSSALVRPKTQSLRAPWRSEPWLGPCRPSRVSASPSCPLLHPSRSGRPARRLR
ncbi:MAG: hypothetical protein WBQ17_15360 [Rhizomicrobium sp.]